MGCYHFIIKIICGSFGWEFPFANRRMRVPFIVLFWLRREAVKAERIGTTGNDAKRYFPFEQGQPFRSFGCFPFTKYFSKFRLGCKWNTAFCSAHWKNSGRNGTSGKSSSVSVPVRQFDQNSSFFGETLNDTHSSRTEIRNRDFRKFFVNGKKTSVSQGNFQVS